MQMIEEFPGSVSGVYVFHACRQRESASRRIAYLVSALVWLTRCLVQFLAEVDILLNVEDSATYAHRESVLRGCPNRIPCLWSECGLLMTSKQIDHILLTGRISSHKMTADKSSPETRSPCQAIDANRRAFVSSDSLRECAASQVAFSNTGIWVRDLEGSAILPEPPPLSTTPGRVFSRSTILSVQRFPVNKECRHYGMTYTTGRATHVVKYVC